MNDEALHELASQTDQLLLNQFIASRSEEAFHILVERHGPMVLGVCRRGAPSTADAEDAFQATFLVLAQSAKKVRKQKSLAAWLFGVAGRVSARLRRDKARRNTVQLFDALANEAMIANSHEPDPLDELLARHDQALIDQELSQLPESLRSPMVLRYLAGQSNAAVAEELGISMSALEGRLKRAKQRLRVRLIRQGITLSAVVAILKTTRVTASELPTDLLSETVTTCSDPTSASSNTPTTSEPTGTSPPHLALEELHAMNAMLVTKPIAAMLSATAIATLLLGSQLAMSQNNGEGQQSLTLNTTENSIEIEQSNAITVSPNEKPDPTPNDNYGGYGGMEGGYGGREGGYGGMEGGYGGMEGPVPTKATKPRTSSHPNRKLGRYDVKKLSDVEIHIEQTLDRQLEERIDFSRTALIEVVQYLADNYGIQIFLDQQALDDVGLGPDEPVSINVRDVTLRSALRMILSQLDITYVFQNEVMLITTPEEAETELETRIYPLNEINAEEKALSDIITSTIASRSWAVNGGGEAEIKPLNGLLVVSQTQAVHEAINEFFDQLARSQEE